MDIIRILLFLALAGVAGYYSLTAFYKRYQYLMLGAAEDRTDNSEDRIRGFFRYVIGQGKVLAEPAGIAHFIIFYGFIVISIGALDFFVFQLSGGHHIPGLGSKAFTLLHETMNVLVLIALAVAALRRYVLKPMRLDVTLEAGLIVGMIALLIITDFLFWGVTDALEDRGLGFAAPVASWLASHFAGASEGALTVWKEIFFWAHTVVLLYFAVFIPRSKHLHMVGAMFNTYFRKTDSRPKGRLKKLDLEDESIEEFGVGRVDQWSWKQLLDGYACTECGRCHVNCPATLSGTDLSPKYLILKMKDHLIDVGDNLLAQKQTVKGMDGTGVEVAATATAELPMLIGDIYSEDEIWACTTCRACEEACPVFNEHVDKIIDMRRWLVLTEGKAESEVNRAFQNLERQSNEWGQNRKTRGDWAKELDIPTMGDVDGEVEWLYYVGSSASFDVRNQKIAIAFAKLMKQAGVNFAILGAEEESDGDSARRLGNEFLYQSLVEANVEIFKEYGVKKIVTTCPHAYNTFKNEYPDFGYEAEVVLHHSELLAQLIDEGKLTPTHEVDQLITYHDSCYLGRYNDVYTAPRYILSHIPGVKLVEMDRNYGKSMCCGAGGGGLFKEDTGKERINVMRTEQALETGATAISTACPYCMTMITDGTKAKEVEDTMPVYDVCELLAQSVLGPNH
ncbi:MAG: (Fe-S)-binding protein [Tumebacillaceae bacterium]